MGITKKIVLRYIAIFDNCRNTYHDIFNFKSVTSSRSFLTEALAVELKKFPTKGIYSWKFNSKIQCSVPNKQDVFVKH